MRKVTWAVIPVLLTTLALFGCGAKGTEQTIHANDNLEITVSLSPTPVAMMQDEGLTIQFLNDGKTTEIKDVSLEMVMPSMTMDDKVELTEVEPGEFQGNYRFSMTGKWDEKIHYTEGNQQEVAALTWDVKNE